MTGGRRLRVTVGAALGVAGLAVSSCGGGFHHGPAASPLVFRGAAAHYYVDCSRPGGGDGSLARPWNKLGPANRTGLPPGSTLLLARGSTCHGFLATRGSGTKGHPIVIGAYGRGSLPRIETDGAGADSVVISDESFVAVQDLELTNRGDYLTPRRGVHVVAHRPGTTHDILLQRLFIHDVDGLDTKDLGGNGGIQVDGASANIAIFDNRVQDVNRSGIWVSGAGLPPRPRSGRSWRSATTGVVIAGNTVLRVGGDGIVPTGTVGAVVAGNVVCCGNLRGRRPVQFDAGIWTFNANGTVIEDNEVYGMRNRSTDGTGYDVDYDQDGTIVQDNYGHDNAGGFILLCTDNEPRAADVRFNLSTGEVILDQARCGLNGGRGGTLSGLRVYNNTFITPTPLVRQNSAYNSASLSVTGSFRFLDNIVYANRPQAVRFPCGRYCVANLFFNLPPSGSRAITANPLFAGGLGSSTGRLAAAMPYRLRAGSPAVAAGISVPGNAATDYFGDPLTSPPAIGFYQPR